MPGPGGNVSGKSTGEGDLPGSPGAASTFRRNSSSVSGKIFTTALIGNHRSSFLLSAKHSCCTNLCLFFNGRLWFSGGIPNSK